VNQGPASARKARFDALKLAAEGTSLSGKIDARTLQRVADRLAPGEAAVPIAWSIVGAHDALQRPALIVSIDGSLPLICQRCLQLFDASLSQRTQLLLARDDAELKRLDADEADEVVLAATLLDALTLVEDEVLLSLPFAPHHDEGRCAAGAAWTDAGVQEARRRERSPFASLAGLRQRR
jgi:uncharacterized protein